MSHHQLAQLAQQMGMQQQQQQQQQSQQISQQLTATQMQQAVHHHQQMQQQQYNLNHHQLAQMSQLEQQMFAQQQQINQQHLTQQQHLQQQQLGVEELHQQMLEVESVPHQQQIRIPGELSEMQRHQQQLIRNRRVKRSVWPDSVLNDVEVKALDVDGEWILCKTCEDHYELNKKGRKPNDPDGFKIKMNAKFKEAAWIMHKERVVTHRSEAEREAQNMKRRSEREKEQRSNKRQHRDMRNSRQEGTFLDADDALDLENTDGASLSGGGGGSIPTSGWRCPGIVPEDFYKKNAELIHAFSKYYVGSYRINIVRDARGEKIMLFAHDCENECVQRDRSFQPICCRKCYDLWCGNGNLKRVIKRMDRYNQVDEVLRCRGKLSDEQMKVLSEFRNINDSNLNYEGKKLKQTVNLALKRCKPSRKRTTSSLKKDPIYKNEGRMSTRKSAVKEEEDEVEDEDEDAVVSAVL